MTQVQARSEAVSNAGWGAKSVVVFASTLDTQSAGAPQSLRRVARNESCLSLAWRPPANAADINVTRYRVNTTHTSSVSHQNYYYTQGLF